MFEITHGTQFRVGSRKFKAWTAKGRYTAAMTECEDSLSHGTKIVPAAFMETQASYDAYCLERGMALTGADYVTQLGIEQLGVFYELRQGDEVLVDGEPAFVWIRGGDPDAITFPPTIPRLHDRLGVTRQSLGPFTADLGRGVLDREGNRIAVLSYAGGRLSMKVSSEETIGNTFLFAASSELLGVCESVLEQITLGDAADGNQTDLEHCAEQLRRVIGIAKGEGQ